MTDLSAIIARLEAGPVYLTHKEAYNLAIFFGSDTALGMASLIRKAFVGGSLDAALALAERALPEWRVFGISDGRDFQFNHGWGAGVGEKAGPGIQHAKAPTPALALVIAILKASKRE